MSIIGNVLFYTILIGLLCISCMMIIFAKQGKQPTIMGYKFYSVLTGSMEPTIKVGDLVMVKETEPELIKVGDVITFSSESSSNVTTHRVVEILNKNNEIKYVTQGDANNTTDPLPIKSNQLIGKVNKVIPTVGKTMYWMKNNIYIMLLGMGGIFVIFCILTKLFSLINKN